VTQTHLHAPAQWRTLTRLVFFGLNLICATTAIASDVVTISGSPASTVIVGNTYSFTPTTTDSAGRKVSFSIASKPSWATFSTTTGKLSGTPSSANVGKYSNILIDAYDGVSSAAKWFSITVQASSGGTTSTVKISGTPLTSVTVGSSYKFQPTASDSAGKTLSFSVSNKPSWATFSIANGLLSGTPTSAQTGTYSNIVVSASDGTSKSALPAFAIKVATATTSTGSATVHWANPTQNTNGTTLMNLAGVHLHYGTSTSALTHEITVASATQTSYTISGLTSGTWYFGATAYNTSGAESAMSDIGSKAIN
jgi:Putative Ig domain